MTVAKPIRYKILCASLLLLLLQYLPVTYNYMFLEHQYNKFVCVCYM
jgi:hypothetical protein